MMNVFDPRAFQSTSQWLIDELRRAIIEMEFLPGTRLSEQEIAQRYNVSRQPVREAMISLARLNLVDIRPQRGTYVCHLSTARIRESRLLREAIELAIVRQACLAFDVAAAREIEINLDEQVLHAKHGDRRAFQQADARFHDLLACGAGFPHAWETIQSLKLHTDRLCKLTLNETGHLSELIGHHRSIFAAVLDQDSARGEAAMRIHLSAILEDIATYQAAQPDWFLD
jgi:DNA-binding GntR family transcriptional regulator